MKGKLVTIRIRPEIHKKTREMGLNISRTCENALEEAVTKLGGSSLKTMTNGGSPENEILTTAPTYVPVEPVAWVQIQVLTAGKL